MKTEQGSGVQALCPECLRVLPAEHQRRGDDIWLVRTCPEHGLTEAVIWRGEPDLATWRRPKTPSAPPVAATPVRRGCPYDCGLCPDHGQHTCTAVVEVTQTCNLACPVCYASSSASGGSGKQTDTADPTLAELARRFAHLRRTAGACNVQLSGGEPTGRDDLPEIIAAARAQHFGLVQLNTNGLRLAGDAAYARTLVQAGLQSVFLQFDGPDAACVTLRGRPLLAEKLRAIDHCAKAGLGVVLVPTLVRGVNDASLGEILRLALAHMPTVRGVHFQPAAHFGRFPGGLAGTFTSGPHLTLPEVLQLLVQQSSGMLCPEDFHPPCCEHERCSFSARFVLREGRLEPITGGSCCGPEVTVEPVAGEQLTAAEGARRAKSSVAAQWAMADEKAVPAAPPRDDFERFLAARAPSRSFSISCMAFQDAATLEIERVRGCCIHTQTADGRLIPFCLYNLTAHDGTTLYRGQPQGEKL